MMMAAKTGELVTAQIVRILPLGLFVQVAGSTVMGLIRERELAWDGAARGEWRQRFHVGQEVRALVLDDRRDDGGHVELSLRRAEIDPRAGLAARFPLGCVADGVVTGLQPYGTFVELEPGVVGLLHVSQLPQNATRAPEELFWPGDHVKVLIDQVDEPRRRIGLSMASLARRRWEAAGAPAGAQALAHPQAPAARAARPAAAGEGPARLPLELLLQRPPATILIVEDDPEQCRSVANWLANAGQRPVTADSVEQGLAILDELTPDLVLMDFSLPGKNGAAGLREIRRARPQIRCALMTDWSRALEHSGTLEGLRADGVSLLIKPLLPEDLLDLLFAGPETDRPQGTPAATLGRAQPAAASKQPSLAALLDDLRRLTRAAKVILFSLDPASRQVEIQAESGSLRCQSRALLDLVHSPVRDAAEDRVIVESADVNGADADRFRYLQPLLPFAACLGVPVPAHTVNRYALFLFYARPGAIDATCRGHALASATAIGAALERRSFLAQATEMQRLAMLGQLSGALVHEVNHRLGAITFTMDDVETQWAALERQAERDPRALAAELQVTGEAIARLSSATRSLTKTARLFGQLTRTGHDQILLLQTVVEEAVEMVRNTAARAHVSVEVAPCPSLIFTRAQVAQVQHVLLNILLNAVQQIEVARPDTGGRVQVRLMWEEGLLCIQVEDDGPGIHRRLWERIFELGFTTRQDGSGLGLFICRNLADALGGRVYVAESHILWGTVFAIELPFQI